MGSMAKIKKPTLKVISYKISEELYERLDQIAKTEIDEAGLALSVPLLARRLVLEGLKEREKALISTAREPAKKGR